MARLGFAGSRSQPLPSLPCGPVFVGLWEVLGRAIDGIDSEQFFTLVPTALILPLSHDDNPGRHFPGQALSNINIEICRAGNLQRPAEWQHRFWYPQREVLYGRDKNLGVQRGPGAVQCASTPGDVGTPCSIRC